jgi:hypothetical protein
MFRKRTTAPTNAEVTDSLLGGSSLSRTAGRVHRVEGAALQRWIVVRRQERNGLKGLWFRQSRCSNVAAKSELP